MKMLNEMNPKLRRVLGSAALAAALGIGTVGCATPNDDPPIENPATTVTFETLGVADFAESLARAKKDPTTYGQIASLGSQFDERIYQDKELGFIPLKVNENNQYEDGQKYIRYIDLSTSKIFYVPVSMESDFDTAIAAYKAAHAE